jgi:hypothetical protein
MTGRESEQVRVGRRRWETITIVDVGHIGEVLQGGGGKLSPSPHDPGETFKPPGQN